MSKYCKIKGYKCGFVLGEKRCVMDMSCTNIAKWIAEHDKQIETELLDMIVQKSRTIITEDGVMYKVVFLKDIEEMKAEVENDRAD